MKVITQPAAEPVTLSEVKDRLSINDTFTDNAITSYIKSARLQAEQYTDSAFVDRTLEFALDRFPTDIELPVLPASSITSIKYLDADGVEQTLSSSVYGIDDYSPRHWIILAQDQDWPDTLDSVNAVKVQYVAGYGAAGSDVPEDIRQAIIIAVSHWLRFKETLEAIGPTRMPQQFYDLLSPYRVMRVI